MSHCLKHVKSNCDRRSVFFCCGILQAGCYPAVCNCCVVTVLPRSVSAVRLGLYGNRIIMLFRSIDPLELPGVARPASLRSGAVGVLRLAFAKTTRRRTLARAPQEERGARPPVPPPFLGPRRRQTAGFLCKCC